jgi:hypothetical protein
VGRWLSGGAGDLHGGKSRAVATSSSDLVPVTVLQGLSVWIYDGDLPWKFQWLELGGGSDSSGGDDHGGVPGSSLRPLGSSTAAAASDIPDDHYIRHNGFIHCKVGDNQPLHFPSPIPLSLFDSCRSDGWSFFRGLGFRV